VAARSETGTPSLVVPVQLAREKKYGLSRFSPERHLRAAQLLGANVSGLTATEMPEVLPRTLLSLMRDTGISNGLHALGYAEADVSALIDGTLKQQRLLVNCPRAVGAEELQQVIQQSFEYW
jgi:hydroxyacid-oxoacid transhydrogenase